MTDQERINDKLAKQIETINGAIAKLQATIDETIAATWGGVDWGDVSRLQFVIDALKRAELIEPPPPGSPG